MQGLLRIHGPATATSLATRLGINTGQTSYHLRHLADHGFVVDDEERGNGRERWWKAAPQSTLANTVPSKPEDQDALDA
jgi:predicted ArsR family transcriptional regulator